jgi:D-ribose pyranase
MGGFLLRNGILNPALRSLLARVRHTNTLVIADRGFPFWPGIETVDLALIDDIPTVAQVLDAVVREWQAGQAWMAEEFRAANGVEAVREVGETLRGIPLVFEPHYELKLRVPGAIGLIRTGDTVQYANIVLESA